jgi:hypothetical protein
MSFYPWVYYAEATERCPCIHLSTSLILGIFRLLLIELLAEGFFKMKYKNAIQPGCARTVY